MRRATVVVGVRYGDELTFDRRGEPLMDETATVDHDQAAARIAHLEQAMASQRAQVDELDRVLRSHLVRCPGARPEGGGHRPGG